MRPRIESALARLRGEAARRTFGVPDEDRRQILRHGYLLALEDVERELQLREQQTSDTNAA